jgi:hypothetical protein
MIICSDLIEKEKLVHIDQKGKVLWESSYKEAVDTFAFFSEKEVIVPNVTKGQLEIIDLTNYQTRTHPHEFTFPDSASLELHAFYDTRYLCVQESGLIGDGKLILSYYAYTSHSFDKISQFKSEEGEWNYGQSASKANNHSKIAWWKDYFIDEIVFNFWDLSQQEGGRLGEVKVRNTLANIHS